MIRFPLIQELSVDDYALYPGASADRNGFTAPFLPGLTVVLGANGLGKTTLVWLLYRMLCGPYDIQGLSKGGRLGTRRLTAQLIPKERQLFSRRVIDRAENAVAHLRFDLGQRHIVVTRKLQDLALTGFAVDGDEFSADEEVYQSHIASLSGVWSFGDWILLLRHLTFYFEDRRALVWDPTAQIQICRLLFLPSQKAREWTERERRILELDSQARNLKAAVSKEEQSLATDERLQLSVPEIQAELSTLAGMQESDQKKLDGLDEAILSVDAIRKAARLSLLAAEHEREAALRALEHAKLAALQERFPTAAETAQYILAQLFAEGACLVCGNEVPEMALAIESRIDDSRCVVCDTPIDGSMTRSARTERLSEKRIARASASLRQADVALAAARSLLDDRQEEYRRYRRQFESASAAISQRRSRMDALIRQLPDEAKEVLSRREELALLRARVEVMKEDLKMQRVAFNDFIEEVRHQIIDRAPVIQEVFERYAREFLVEDCHLRWKVLSKSVGQTGPRVGFPVFELDLASASYRSPVRRSGPDEVSESQREFIDLAFRMALMEAGDRDFGGTMVIDAPEASLDAVFVSRAAEVLARFGAQDGTNRLLVTSNLTDGNLIPRLFQACNLLSRDQRVVDLLEIAEPTAAVRQHSEEYADVMGRLWSFAEEGTSQ